MNHKIRIRLKPLAAFGTLRTVLRGSVVKFEVHLETLVCLEALPTDETDLAVAMVAFVKMAY